MYQPGDLHDIVVKDPHRVGVRQHQTRGLFAEVGFQVFQVYHALFVRLDLHGLVPGHRCAGGVGAVGGVRDQDLGPRIVLPVGMVCLDQQKPGEFTLCAGRRLQGKAVHPGDLAEILFQGGDGFQRPFQGPFRLQGVQFCKSR